MSAGTTGVVGVVGGGQLARMLHQAAISLAIRVVVLDPDPGCAAAAAGAERFDGTWTSADDLVAFANSGVDVVTFDHELADPDDLVRLEAASPVPVRPAPATKVLAQDKLVARTALEGRGFGIPAFAAVHDVAQVQAFAAEHGWPVVLKTSRGGYDGRGVWIVRDAREAAEVLAAGDGFMVEELVDIREELAVMVARRPGGSLRSWPVFRTTQVEGICTEVILAAGSPLTDRARALAERLAEHVELTGVMAVEFFVDAGGELLVNELACRPHNSGHVTMDSCITDQFEQHLRAVLDLPLGATEPTVDVAVMVNVLGGAAPWSAEDFADAVATDRTSLHLYGKGHRPGRKLGHVNAVGDSVEETLGRARKVAAVLGGSD
ncbi:MAG: 5-(carboxyamino)imidazole ribonucleotide synthase [Solirubrobacterales bacterium]|nr:5-(carboxyamino)imidazole ribonucleotide synthase [Solirubrobacterales bacterium]